MKIKQYHYTGKLNPEIIIDLFHTFIRDISTEGTEDKSNTYLKFIPFQLAPSVPKVCKDRQAFTLPIILNWLDIQIADDAAHLVQFSFSIFTLSLVCLCCFLNVIFYLTSYILYHKYDVENKPLPFIKKSINNYPRIRKYINYYINTSLIFVLIDVFLCLFSLIIIIGLCLSIIYISSAGTHT